MPTGSFKPAEQEVNLTGSCIVRVEKNREGKKVIVLSGTFVEDFEGEFPEGEELWAVDLQITRGYRLNLGNKFALTSTSDISYWGQNNPINCFDHTGELPRFKISDFDFNKVDDGDSVLYDLIEEATEGKLKHLTGVDYRQTTHSIINRYNALKGIQARELTEEEQKELSEIVLVVKKIYHSVR